MYSQQPCQHWCPVCPSVNTVKARLWDWPDNHLESRVHSPGVMWQLLFSSHLTPYHCFPLSQTDQPTYNPSDYLE